MQIENQPSFFFTIYDKLAARFFQDEREEEEEEVPSSLSPPPRPPPPPCCRRCLSRRRRISTTPSSTLAALVEARCSLRDALRTRARSSLAASRAGESVPGMEAASSHAASSIFFLVSFFFGKEVFEVSTKEEGKKIINKASLSHYLLTSHQPVQGLERVRLRGRDLGEGRVERGEGGCLGF